MTDASERNRWATRLLVEEGRRRGFRVATEHEVPGGRVDVVWLDDALADLPHVSAAVPVVGFEVESSWRTRKHVKGDLHNLAELGASVGIVVLLGNDDRVKRLVTSARRLAERSTFRAVVWTGDDVRALVGNPPVRPEAAGSDQDHTGLQIEPHAGKYRKLWRWLRGRSDDAIRVTFQEIEDILGFGLPDSCRQHPAHWASYEGSAVARAIHDAGFRARELDLVEETVVFVRDSDAT